MRDVLLLNDIHLGVQRAAGTTPKSAAALRNWLQDQLRDLMCRNTDKHLCLNGDIFDEFAVPLSDVFGFYYTARRWLLESAEVAGEMPKLILGRGNHDVAKDSSRMSSFDLVGQILTSEWPERVVVIAEPDMIFPGIYMIPHLDNQQLFDEALATVPDDAKRVLLHANYNNGFTSQSDHSLNVTEAQVDALNRRLIFGHEHQYRQAGKVLVTGNQFPSSIADCLRNPGGKKYMHVLSEAGIVQYETWDGAQSFQDIDWQDIELSLREGVQFIRVSGQAKAEQASDVIAAISKLRQRSDVFIVSNAVQIEGVQDIADLPASIEDARRFDVMGFLFEQLTPKQAEVVKSLLAKQEEKDLA